MAAPETLRDAATCCAEQCPETASYLKALAGDIERAIAKTEGKA
jgi:hypothetical protein